MNNPIVSCTPHFLRRFSERVSHKSRRRQHFAEQAYLYGTTLDQIANCHLYNYCEMNEICHGSKAKIYHGFVYWFRGNVAVTVFQLPKQFKYSI